MINIDKNIHKNQINLLNNVVIHKKLDNNLIENLKDHGKYMINKIY